MSAPKIRVAHLITRLCQGGAQENTFHTVRLANTARFEVDLISGPTHGPEGSIEDAIADAHIPVQREPWLVRQPAPVRDYLTYYRLLARFKQRRYHIVHAHTSKAGILGRMAALRAGVPVIVHTPHGNVFHGYFNRPLTKAFVALERKCARFTDRIIELTSGGVEEHLAERIGRREQFRVIFSGIDLAPFTSARARRMETRAALGVAPDEILVGGVGRLEPVKGFPYFVEAAAAIAQAAPNARFVLAGDGSQAAALQAQAAPLGSRFQFLGRRADVPDLMAAFDVLVVPSVNEGMGRVLLEAGAAGTPAVASAVGGIPDVVDDGETGLLTPPRDPQAMAADVLRLVQDAGLRRALGDQALAKVVPHYSLEAMVARIEALYEEVLDEKARHARG